MADNTPELHPSPRFIAAIDDLKQRIDNAFAAQVTPTKRPAWTKEFNQLKWTDANEINKHLHNAAKGFLQDQLRTAPTPNAPRPEPIESLLGTLSLTLQELEESRFVETLSEDDLKLLQTSVDQRIQRFLEVQILQRYQQQPSNTPDNSPPMASLALNPLRAENASQMLQETKSLYDKFYEHLNEGKIEQAQEILNEIKEKELLSDKNEQTAAIDIRNTEEDLKQFSAPRPEPRYTNTDDEITHPEERIQRQAEAEAKAGHELIRKILGLQGQSYLEEIDHRNSFNSN